MEYAKYYKHVSPLGVIFFHFYFQNKIILLCLNQAAISMYTLLAERVLFRNIFGQVTQCHKEGIYTVGYKMMWILQTNTDTVKKHVSLTIDMAVCECIISG